MGCLPFGNTNPAEAARLSGTTDEDFAKEMEVRAVLAHKVGWRKETVVAQNSDVENAKHPP